MAGTKPELIPECFSSHSKGSVAKIEVTGGLLKAIKKNTGKTRVEMGRALNISEKWYGLIESGEKKVSQKIKEKARSRFRKDINEILENEKTNVYLADPDLLEEFLEFAGQSNLRKKHQREKSNNTLLKIESLTLGLEPKGGIEEMADLRSMLLPDDLEKAKIYLAAFDTDFESKAGSPENRESLTAVRWFLKTMNHVFSQRGNPQISKTDLFQYRKALLPEDRKNLMDVAKRVDESNGITEESEDSMVYAWKLLIGLN